MREKVRKSEEEHDSGRVWRNILGYIDWGSTCGAPTKLTNMAGQLTTSPAAMAEVQNSYYINKVEKICAQLPRQGVLLPNSSNPWQSVLAPTLQALP